MGQFVGLGFSTITGSVESLLFVACLVMPFRRVSALVAVVTAFAVAHSITLLASAYSLAPDVLWYPPLIDTLVALSVVYLALENIVSPQLRRRSVAAFAFGLAYGFLFSFALRNDQQLAGTHAAIADRANVRLLVDHFRRRACRDEGVEAGDGAARDRDEHEWEPRSRDDRSAAPEEGVI